MERSADVNVGPQLIASTAAVTAVATFTYILRLYVRLGMLKYTGWDDYTMGLAMACCFPGFGLIVAEVHYGAGRHAQFIPPEHIPIGLKLNFITQPLYFWAIFFVKVSIGLFLLRIATVRIYRQLIISILVFLTSYSIGCFITMLVQCVPLSLVWDPTSSSNGRCWTTSQLQALSYASSALNILTDFIFAVFIPMAMLWNVKMNLRTKLSILAILGLGTFAALAAVVKVMFLGSYGKTGDFLWDSRNLTIWTVVECTVGIIAGNLSCIKPLVRGVLNLSSYGTSGPNAFSYSNSHGRRSCNTGRFGSRRRDVAQIITDPESKHDSSGKDDDSIERDAIFSTKVGKTLGADKDTHMMTRIVAKAKAKKSMESECRRSDEEGLRSESITTLPRAHLRPGEILKNTTFTVE